MQRVASIDIGTNTALLLIADVDKENNSLCTINNYQEIIRLGAGVDKHRVINSDAINRLISCLMRYKKIIAEHHVVQVFAVATSAVRDAVNRDEVIFEVKSQCGFDIQLLSGEEEAEWTCRGAVAGWDDVNEPFLVLDIGGGSTEIVLSSSGSIIKKVSLDIGAVRLTERYFSSLPPNAQNLIAAKKLCVDYFSDVLSQFISGRECVVGVAGTIVTLAKQAAMLKTFNNDILHGYQLEFRKVSDLRSKFETNTINDLVLSGVESGRADIILAGTIILESFMRVFGVKRIIVSTQGLRYGIIMQRMT